MRNHRKTRQVEFLNKPGRIVCEGIEVITTAWLVGPAVPSSVETDAPKSLLCECNDLIVPHLTVAAEAVQKRIGAPWPHSRQNNCVPSFAVMNGILVILCLVKVAPGLRFD